MALRVARHVRKHWRRKAQQIDAQHCLPNGDRRRLGEGTAVHAEHGLAAALHEITRWIPVVRPLVTRGEQHRLDTVARNSAGDPSPDTGGH